MPLKINLLYCYEVLWIHNIDAICTLMIYLHGIYYSKQLVKYILDFQFNKLQAY